MINNGNNGNFWYGKNTNFPGFLYKKKQNIGVRRSTKFGAAGNPNNKMNYNKYKAGNNDIGGTSISVRRAKNRLSSICYENQCGRFQTYLGRYSKYTQNPNGYFIYPNFLPTIPSAPYIVSYNILNNHIYIYFTIGSNGESPIINYQYSIDGGNTFISLTPSQTNSPLELPNITGSFNLIIRAVNSVGAGPFSNSISILNIPQFIYQFNNLGNWSDQVILERIPIRNLDNSFYYFVPTILRLSGNLVQVKVEFLYNDNGSIRDGLTFLVTQDGETQYYDNCSVNIIQFGGIPLARTSGDGFSFIAGRQFRRIWDLILSATDAPTIQTSTLLFQMFDNGTNNIGTFNSSFNHWDFSSITIPVNLQAFLEGCSSFNQPITCLYNLNIVSTVSMFNKASSFNQNMSALNTNSLTDVTLMFSAASSFNNGYPPSDNSHPLNWVTNFSIPVATFRVGSALSNGNNLNNLGNSIGV